MPIDIFLTPHSTEPITPQDYKSQAMKRLFDASQLVKKNLEQARLQQKQQFDKQTKNFVYQVGDKVLLDVRTVTPSVSKKLLPRFEGPYWILKICNNHTI